MTCSTGEDPDSQPHLAAAPVQHAGAVAASAAAVTPVCVVAGHVPACMYWHHQGGLRRESPPGRGAAVRMQEADVQEGHTAGQEAGGDGACHQGAEVSLLAAPGVPATAAPRVPAPDDGHAWQQRDRMLQQQQQPGCRGCAQLVPGSSKPALAHTAHAPDVRLPRQTKQPSAVHETHAHVSPSSAQGSGLAPAVLQGQGRDGCPAVGAGRH